jgi:hypothetical protein
MALLAAVKICFSPCGDEPVARPVVGASHTVIGEILD